MAEWETSLGTRSGPWVPRPFCVCVWVDISGRRETVQLCIYIYNVGSARGPCADAVRAKKQ